MSLCPEAKYRASLSDGEFWAYVLQGVRPNDPRDDLPGWDYDLEPPAIDDTYTAVPCPVCGVFLGACGYDADGRAYIHCSPDDSAA